MKNYRMAAVLLIAGCIAVASIAFMQASHSEAREEWSVGEDGLLDYSLTEPEYHLGPLETSDNSTLCKVVFSSRGAEIAGLLRRPLDNETATIPAVVLLPGAGITKEQEQGFARYLSGKGFASLTLDQRNLGAIDIQGDFQRLLKGEEPEEHKMVHDALAAAAILRSIPGIDKDRVIYAGESNGARFAIIACSIDSKSAGAIAISTCGLGADEAISTGRLDDPEAVKFYRSIDPETYFKGIPPRKLVMLHSLSDPVIPFEYANRTYRKALEPKAFYMANCTVHGRCPEMDSFLRKELAQMAA